MTSMMTYSNIGGLGENVFFASIKVKDIKPEVFQDYKKCSMFIGVSTCDFKCCKEASLPCSTCQNFGINAQEDIIVDYEDILKMFKKSLLSEAVVIGGLEPFLQVDEVVQLIRYFRDRGVKNDFVIYTGYYPEEINKNTLEVLKKLENVIIKYGRYIPNKPNRFDEVLGVSLASDNQYAVKL